MNVFLLESICNWLISKYIKYFKHVLSVSATTPNAFFTLSEPYNLPDINQIQLTIHIINFINSLNNNDTLGMLTKISLKELQLSNWFLTDFLSPTTLNPLKIKNNLTGKILQQLLNLNINIASPNTKIFEHTGGYITIKQILNDDKLYKSNIISLKHCNLFFIDQIIDPLNKKLFI